MLFKTDDQYQPIYAKFWYGVMIIVVEPNKFSPGVLLPIPFLPAKQRSDILHNGGTDRATFHGLGALQSLPLGLKHML